MAAIRAHLTFANIVSGIAVAAIAVVLLVPAASAHAADSILPPPPLSFVPDRGGASAGAPCGGSVRCVPGTDATISAAVAAANPGDTIQVQAGTYNELVVVSGKAVTLLGGFAAGFATRNPAANPTVINGQNAGTTLTLDDAGNSTIDGFTITGGRAPLVGNSGGGSGIRVVDSGAVTIRNNLIEANNDAQNFNTCGGGPGVCSTFGGGILVASNVPGSSVTVAGNVIRDNRALKGAAMAVFVNALIEGNLVEANHAGGDHGGGLYLSAPNITVRSNLITGNTIGDQAGYGWGGGAIFDGNGQSPTLQASFEANRWAANSAPSIGSGLYIDEDAAAEIDGDLFHDNSCDGTGGAALYVDGTGVAPSGSTATLENVTITDHACAADKAGSAIFTEGGSSVAITNSIITGNGGSSQIFVCTDCQPLPAPPPSTIAYSILGGGAVNVTSGAGMLSGSPGFLNPAADDFHLAPTSQAIDTADPASPVGLEPEPNGGRRNIGAYGGSVEATTTGVGGTDSDGDGVPNAADACPAIAGATANGCPNIKRTLSFSATALPSSRGSAASPRVLLKGKLGPKGPCAARQKVTIFRTQPGRDPRVASAKTKKNGTFQRAGTVSPGAYYAKVGRKTIATAGNCLPKKSRSVVVRAP